MALTIIGLFKDHAKFLCIVVVKIAAL
jgi:hypothetical protein